MTAIGRSRTDTALRYGRVGTAYRLLDAYGQAKEAFEQAIELAITLHATVQAGTIAARLLELLQP